MEINHWKYLTKLYYIQRGVKVGKWGKKGIKTLTKIEFKKHPQKKENRTKKMVSYRETLHLFKPLQLVLKCSTHLNSALSRDVALEHCFIIAHLKSESFVGGLWTV